MCAIQLSGIQKGFGSTSVLSGVDLSIEQGEFCVFIGPSGCGKSTLLRIIAGLEDPSEGDIRIDGVRVNHLEPAKRDVAMVFQSYALYPHMTVKQNLEFGLKHQKLLTAEIDKRVAAAAETLHLTPLLERKPGALSGGQRQRVAIGRAIVRKPKVFLFDEPLSNLDATLRVKTRVEIAKLHRALNTTSMIYVTHDQVEAMTLADKIVLLRPLAGQEHMVSIAQVGTPLELYHHPANRFVASFIGSPSMNFIAGEVAALASDGIVTAVAEHQINAAVAPGALKAGDKVTLGIRPEHIELGSGSLTGNVAHVEYLGEHAYVYLETELSRQPLVAKSAHQDIEIGSLLRFNLPATSLHLFDGNDVALPRLLGSVRQAA
ncbi:ABC transporter ATP-binding protein [Leeia oryzae]|uniref:ABC transporter ATP-binding protein n=1 Tax=Leeia oryzae TaxID=356662 RepID=UPI0003787D8A|nr:sn-glycerol-3-phosphate ABC transporter ATP-binding protein UgpC [Leeia oryzae]